MIHTTNYFSVQEDGRVRCDLCPRFCKLAEGQRGLCFVRKNINQRIELTTFGRSSGFCIDPIEKKPLNHFYPGTPILSFGTAGCNLSCKFCQNWDISKSREMDKLMNEASPKRIAEVAKQLKCKSIAFTYNDPVIFMEYAIEISKECRKLDVKTVAVTAGYINEEPRREFFQYIDAANVDLKSFSTDFYKKITGGDLESVKSTLKYLVNKTDVWTEITTLLIPGKNDSDSELEKMTRWIAKELGNEVPLHFSAFHPDWKMRDIPRTPAETLWKAQKIAKKNGLQFVYTGNIHDKQGSSTYCPNCSKSLIGRDWYVLSDWNLNSHGRCRFL